MFQRIALAERISCKTAEQLHRYLMNSPKALIACSGSNSELMSMSIAKAMQNWSSGSFRNWLSLSPGIRVETFPGNARPSAAIFHLSVEVEVASSAKRISVLPRATMMH